MAALAVLVGIVIGAVVSPELGVFGTIVGLLSTVFFGIVAPRIDHRRGLR